MKQLVLSLLILITISGFSANKYIATTGNDTTGNGSIGTPWRSIYKAFGSSINGDVVRVASGTYVESRFCSLPIGVSLVGAGESITKIYLTYPTNAGIYLNSSTVVSGNQVISDIAFNGNNLIGWSAITVSKVGNVSIYNCSFTNFKTDAVFFVNQTGSAPSVWTIGNKFYNNVVTNCATYDAGSTAMLYCTGQQGMQIYNNTLTGIKRGTVSAPFCIKTNYTRGLIIRDNTVNIREHDDNTQWAFALETWNTTSGAKIYNNRFRGIVDIAGGFTTKGDSTFSCKFYNNIVGHDTMQSVARIGIILEADVDSMSYIHIYDNEFKNLQSSININFVSTTKYKNIYIYRNIIHGVGVTSNNYWGQAIGGSGVGGVLSSLYIWNNVIVSERLSNSLSAIVLGSRNTLSNIHIKNNIIKDFGSKYLTSDVTSGGTINTVITQYNNCYNNGGSNEPVWGAVTPSNITNNNNTKVNPLFISTIDFHLDVNSSCINTGIDVGLPYNGIAPDKGVFETLEGTMFYDSWEEGFVTKSTYNHWGSVERVAADRISIISTGARVGTKCARFEVRAGDNPLGIPGINNAEVFAPRNISNVQITENENSGIRKYNFSIKFDATWQQPIDNLDGLGKFVIFYQLRGPDILGTDPLFAFTATDQIKFNVRVGNVAINPKVTYTLSDGSLNIGNWIDFILIIKYSKNNDGYFYIDRRNEGSTLFTRVLTINNIATLQYNPSINGGIVGEHYHKLGLYRNNQTFTSIMYHDEFIITSLSEFILPKYKYLVLNGRYFTYNGKFVKY